MSDMLAISRRTTLVIVSTVLNVIVVAILPVSLIGQELTRPAGVDASGISASDTVREPKAIEAQIRKAIVERAIRAALNSNTRLEFIVTPLSDVIAYLQYLHRIPIELDHDALHRAGVGADLPVTAALHLVTLRAALREVLSEHEMGVLVDDGVLLITTAASANERTFTLIDSVNDLAPDAAARMQLLSTLQSALQENSRTRISISAAGELVVRGPQHELDAIELIVRNVRSELPADQQHPSHPFSRWKLGTSANLSSLPITNDDLASLQHQNHIESLNLGETRIGDDGVGHLRKLTKLKDLRLKRTRVSDEAVAHLRQLKELTTLDVSDTRITDDGLEELADMKQLKRLTLGNTAESRSASLISKEAVEQLRKSLPNCEITAGHFQPRPATPAGADPFGDGEAEDDDDN